GRLWGEGCRTSATSLPERVTRTGARVLRTCSRMPRHLALNSEMAISFTLSPEQNLYHGQASWTQCPIQAGLTTGGHEFSRAVKRSEERRALAPEGTDPMRIPDVQTSADIPPLRPQSAPAPDSIACTQRAGHNHSHRECDDLYIPVPISRYSARVPSSPDTKIPLLMSCIARSSVISKGASNK